MESESETASHFLCYCPFHGNRVDPAFAVDKSLGLWTCFNPSCGESGTLEQLVRRRQGLNVFQAARLIMKYRGEQDLDAEKSIEEAWESKPDFEEFPQEALTRMYNDFWTHPEAQEYMHNRRFNDDTLRYFEVGYSPEKWVTREDGSSYLKPNMVTVPMHDPTGMPIGLIGRTIEGKVFKNSKNLPKSHTMWNLHRAKKHGATVIVVESSMDAMRVQQAGYPNVVALLGGSLSPQQTYLFNRYFSTIVNMTDFDPADRKPDGKCRKCKTWVCQGHRPGRDLGRAIATNLPNKKILWAAYDDSVVFPHGAKDVGDCTDDEIRQCLKNAISDFEYSEWDVEIRLP